MTRVTVSLGAPRGRRHLAVTPCGSASPLPWAIQWANPTQHGYSYEKPIALFKTKKEALRAKAAGIPVLCVRRDGTVEVAGG